MDVFQSSQVRRFIELSALLLLFWTMLNGSLAPDVVLIGVVVSLAIAALLPRGLSFMHDFRFTPRAMVATVLFFGFFFKELVKANLKLAAIVLDPALPLRPGIVKLRTGLKSPMARLLLANSITLTPGTLTVEMDGEWLYVHWITVESDDVNAATEAVVRGFERYLEVMYG